MSTSSFCFIGPQEIILIIFTFTIPAVLVGLVIFALLKYINKSSGKSKKISNELENQLNKFSNESFKPEDIRDYYPVKEGSKISLIRFDEIVDFSADNNYVFLTDVNGKDYVVESNLTELELKLPKDFIRVHKSTIINSKLLGEIKKLANGRYDLIMKCGKTRVISCSKNYNENIKSLIDF
jgi:two-component system, LytTR family, response regulator